MRKNQSGRPTAWTTLLASMCVLVAACGGGGGNEDGTGTLSLAVTDAPVDDAQAVVIQFSGVAFKREGAGSASGHGDSITEAPAVSRILRSRMW